MNIAINGLTLESMSLSVLDGTLDDLLKPADPKPLVWNDSASIDGSLVVPTDRKMKRRDFKMKFLVSKSNEQELYAAISAIHLKLLKGVVDGSTGAESGVNEIKIDSPSMTIRCILNKFDTYNGFGMGKAVVSISFTEINPNNR